MELDISSTEELDQIGIVESLQAGIDDANLPVIIYILSTNFYSNPLGSLIRELTSNSYDANIDNEVDEPVYVSLRYDTENSQWYLEFKDFGKGMTPEIMQNVFMKWGSSTKRGSNLTLGGYGLGSKSPLAYTEYFYITTIAEGIKTEYILNKGTVLPELVPLSSKETSERSGTTIRVDIKENDFFTAKNEIKKQLCYFENLYVNASDFSNEYKLIEGKTFIFNTANRPSNYVHVVVGCVAYPIDWDQLDLNGIGMPLGIKVNIGEVDLTPNRENLRYTDKTKAVLKDKLQAFKEEILEIVEKQNPPITDLHTYILKRNSELSITLGEVDIPVTLEGVNRTIVFEPLKDIDLPENLLFDYSYVTLNRRGKISIKYNIHSRHNINHMYYAKKGVDKYTNIYSGLANSTLILKNHSEFRTYAKYLGLLIHVKKKHKQLISLGTALKIYRYKKVIEAYVEKTARPYNRPSDEWIKEYLKSLRDNTKAQLRKLNGEIIIYNIDGTHRREIKLSKLAEFLMVFYVIRNDKTPNMNLFDYEDLEYFIRRSKYKNKILFISISKTHLKTLETLSGVRHANTFFRVPELQPLFTRVHLANYLYETRNYEGLRNIVHTISTYYSKKVEELCRWILSNRIEVSSEIKGLLKSRYDKNSPKIYKYRALAKELDILIPKLDILQHIKLYSIPTEYLSAITSKLKVLKLNQNLYKYGSFNQTNRSESNP